MKKLLLIFLISLFFFAIHCSNDDNPASADSKQNFSLYIQALENNEGLRVTFYTSSSDVLPNVVVNGETIESFVVRGDYVEGVIGKVEYAGTINFSISANNKTTNGTINMPSTPHTTLCNNIPMQPGSQTMIPSSGTYKFKWQCDDYEFFLAEWFDNEGNPSKYTADKEAMFLPVPDQVYYTLELSALKGVTLIPGSKPNVTGDFGNGYVVTQSDFVAYYFNFSSGLAKASLENNTVVNETLINFVR